MDGDLERLRTSYELGGLAEDDLADTWLAQFREWLRDAMESGMPEPHAMVLGTTAVGGEVALPSARTVLLRSVDGRGFVCFTNLESRKGREVRANPAASLVFPWVALQRQVVVSGRVTFVTDTRADDYWATRPRGHRLGAAASPQSEVVGSRADLEALLANARRAWPDDGPPPPRPPHWGGLRVVPDTVEFWQGRRNRMHDRLRFRRRDQQEWLVERLAP